VTLREPTELARVIQALGDRSAKGADKPPNENKRPEWLVKFHEQKSKKIGNMHPKPSSDETKNPTDTLPEREPGAKPQEPNTQLVATDAALAQLPILYSGPKEVETSFVDSYTFSLGPQIFYFGPEETQDLYLDSGTSGKRMITFSEDEYTLRTLPPLPETVAFSVPHG
jgi:hypothetical protein